MSELQARTLSGLAMLVVALACLWFGDWAFALLVATATGFMGQEWFRLTRNMEFWLRWSGIPYLLLPAFGLLLLRIDGFQITLWTMAVVWATDIGAYFAGRAIGGPKIAPSISPSKTWAGLAGGMIAAAVVGMLLADRPSILWLGAPMAVLAQAGDFFESWLKRRAGVKDSGKILPGHGGALDRLDGLVPVASVMGLLLLYGAI